MHQTNYCCGRVSAIDSIHPDVYLLRVMLELGESLISRAGQYVYLYNGQSWYPYSLASAPSACELKFIIKGTHKIDPFIQLAKKNEIIKISQACGTACMEDNKEQNYLCIAKGIAISPVLSMAEHLRAQLTRSQLHIIWSPSSQDQLVIFRDYFKDVEQITFDYLLYDNTEMFDVDDLRRRANNIADKKINKCFIYGSSAFVNKLYYSLNKSFDSIQTDIPIV